MTALVTNVARRVAWMVVGVNPRVTLLRALMWPVLLVTLSHSLFVPVRVTGFSMSPTYHDGSINVINRTAYLHGGPKRGDVVALKSGNDILLKRIVALPGETVWAHNGKIHVNGRRLNEPVRVTRIDEEIGPLRLGPQQYFFIGDNRRISEFGIVGRGQVLGKALF